MSRRSPIVPNLSPPTNSSDIKKTLGLQFLRNRFTNKGTAFTPAERDRLGITALLPPAVETMENQMARVYQQFMALREPIQQYQLLRNVQDTNNTLFYNVLSRYLEEMLPIIYTPTVGDACLRFGQLYTINHGIYISRSHKGRVKELLSNIGRQEVNIIVITDGSRILGLGDLGANGMGISIGKITLYVAGAALVPWHTLSVVLDVGTNVEALRNNPLYLGERAPRCDDTTYYQLLDEFMEAVRDLWPMATVQFEDFSNNHCFDVLERYRHKYRCFNDDIQGTGAVIGAGFCNAVKISGVAPLEHRIVVYGAGSAAIGVVCAIADLMAVQFSVPREAILQKVYLVDTKGLVTTTRGDSLAPHKVALARTDVPANDQLTTLLDVVRRVRPTAMLGLGGAGPAFTQEMVEIMSETSPRPIIFPLSNPTSKAEINPADAIEWSKGRAIVASGSPCPPTVYQGTTYSFSQGNNMYVFPGIGLGSYLAQPREITDAVILCASQTLANMVSVESLRADGQLYPPLSRIGEVSRRIAVAVIQEIQAEGLGGQNLPTGADELMEYVKERQWAMDYPDSDFYKVENLTV